MVKKLSGIRAVYFDLDDTLCGYWEASKTGLRAAFESHGPDGFEVDELVRHWAAAFHEFAPTLKRSDWYQGYLQSGEATRTEQMRLMLNRLGIFDEDQAAMLSQAYMVERDRALALFPDAIFVLEQLKTRYPLGLITNGPADIQRQEIETLGIHSYFQNVFIEGEMGVGKPTKSVFDRAANVVECQPHELLMVGNSYGHDIRPALDYGWHAVWVRRATDVPPSATTEKNKPESMPLDAPEPDFEIESLVELLDILEH